MSRARLRATRHPLRALLALGALVMAACGGRARATPAPTATPTATTGARSGATATPAAATPTTVSPAEFPAALAARRQELIAAGDRIAPADVGYYMDVQEARLRQVGGTALLVSRVEDRVVLELPGSLTFEVGSARLSSRARMALAGIAKVLVDYRLSVTTVHGFTDDSGDAASNRELSAQRALAVARFLVAEGVDRAHLLAVGHGAARPIADNTTEVGREANRRVELHVEPLRP
jgi:outer membrane protein OmpA-like peptidoglycan-associated protein